MNAIKTKSNKMKEVKTKNQKENETKILNGLEIVNISTNPTERINNCGTPFTENTYRGCGSYWVAVRNGLIQASVLMDDCPIRNFLTFREYSKKKLSFYGKVISGNGSGTQFFCKNSEDLKLFDKKAIYIVPAPNGDGNQGYWHLNFQAL